MLGEQPDNLHFFIKLITLIKYRINCLKTEEKWSLANHLLQYTPTLIGILTLHTEIRSFGHHCLLHTLPARNRTEQLQTSLTHWSPAQALPKQSRAGHGIQQIFTQTHNNVKQCQTIQILSFSCRCHLWWVIWSAFLHSLEGLQTDHYKDRHFYIYWNCAK